MARFTSVGGSSSSPRRKRSRPNVHISSSDSSDSESDSPSYDTIRRRQTVLPVTISSNIPRHSSISQEARNANPDPDLADLFQSENGVVLPDSDVLDCPICLDPLTPPVFQCLSGHLVCNSCINKIVKCPSCNSTDGFNRCIAIEKIIISANVYCTNRQYGCTMQLFYCQKLEHEKACRFTRCVCPHDDCNKVDRSDRLYTHFLVQHSSSVPEFRINDTVSFHLPKDVNKVFLLESRERKLFVLRRSVEALGSLFSLVCVDSTSSGAEYTFKLTTRAGINKIGLKSSVVVTPKCSAQSPKQKCLLITSDFLDELEGLDLQLLVRILE